jgi:hypothetical protein
MTHTKVKNDRVDAQLLTTRRDYHYERPALTFRKLRRLELAAGASKRCNPRGRNAPATPDTAAQWKTERRRQSASKSTPARPSRTGSHKDPGSHLTSSVIRLPVAGDGSPRGDKRTAHPSVRCGDRDRRKCRTGSSDRTCVRASPHERSTSRPGRWALGQGARLWPLVCPFASPRARHGLVPTADCRDRVNISLTLNQTTPLCSRVVAPPRCPTRAGTSGRWLR